MGRKRNSALRREQEYTQMVTQKHNQTFYQKHTAQPESNTINFNLQKLRRPVDLVPKSINQESYILALGDTNNDVVVATGPAGTGKTYLAVLQAIIALRQKKCERIILTRPAVAVEEEKHGFLPGDINQKMEPWTRPLLDVFREFYAPREVLGMLDDGVLEISPLAYMRGRTFKNSYIILDEAQNATPNQIKMLLTRLGSGSRVVVTGDIEQADRKAAENGLLDLERRLADKPTTGISLCKFTLRDVQRHRIIEHVLKLYS